MNFVRLGDVADVCVSGVDKKTMPGEQAVRLCNYTDVYYNWTIRKELSQSFMMASARDGEIAKFRLRAGQVALTKDSETRDDIGHPAYIADDFEDVILGYHCALISPHVGILDGQYLNGLLRTRHISDYLSRNAGGSGQRYYLSDSTIKALPISLPPIDTQLHIAGVLGSLDKKIALNRKKIAELEALAKTIYDYWFVQFDFPDKNGKPYKSSGGKMVWNVQLKREVPVGWNVESLPQIADYLFGNPFDSSLFTTSGKGFPIVRIRNVKDGYTHDRTIEAASKEYIIHNGDFLIGMDGYFDMNHWIGGEAYLVQRSCRIRAKDDLYAAWLSMSLASPIKHLEKSLTGATLAHLGKAHLDKILLPKPPKSMTKELSLLNNLIEQKVHLGIANLELVNQRDTLLPLLMNGQVKAAG